MAFAFSIPGISGVTPIAVEAGSSIVFVGANGGGKTRLAVFIEDALGASAHRISAHRALSLNPAVAKISERAALAGLRTGNANENAQVSQRAGHRWSSQSATVLLNDFDYLVQALFADQANKSLETHQKNRAGDTTRADPTKFERLVEIWERLLPHRKLHITGDNIEVSVGGSASRYLASQMSDGERAIFYMIGQTLVTTPDSLLIFDEPELHVHRAIMAKLWDELEASRQDCGFAFITHDLEFAAARVAQKFIIDDYDPAPRWKLRSVPTDTGFDEATTTLILGSRRPILFVEGTETSLDLAIYRCCYPDWTVLPRGSCEEVIHSVVTMRKNSELTRVTCAGVIDADDFGSSDAAFLSERGIAILPVSEIENLILLPDVSRAIAESEGYSGKELNDCIEKLRSEIFSSINAGGIEDVVVRHCKRRMDRYLKRIEFGDTGTVEQLEVITKTQLEGLNVRSIADAVRSRINKAVTDKDLELLLACYDNKGFLALASTHLKRTRKNDFESWLTRVLRSKKAPSVVKAIQNRLPSIAAR